MHKQQPPHNLIDKVLNMILRQFLPGVDDPVQVSLHQFGYDVDVDVASSGLWLEDVDQADYVVVLEIL